MKQSGEIQKLLRKFILNQCDKEETEKVVAYFKNQKSSEGFPSVEEIITLLEEVPEMDKESAKRIYERIISKQKKGIAIRPAKKRFIRWYAAAALFAGFLTIGYLFQQDFFTDNTNTIIIPKDESITLQLADGTIEYISENGTLRVMDTDGSILGIQKENQLVYHAKITAEKLAYNVLKVPYGKKFELQLSDGTHVHLNSGTSLKYPVHFVKGEDRQVFLSGEAYFEVSEDKTHPFIVNAEELNVRVLGTRFNVACYPEDRFTDVVLVEGSVGMYTKDEIFDAEKNTLLEPGFKGRFDKTQHRISSKEVITGIYTSWINGELVFRNMSFENILKKLERHYNTRIINNDTVLAGELFNASFVNEPIEKVFQNLKTTYGIDFTIDNNQIIIQ